MRKPSSQNCEKKLNSFFFKQFLTPTFCSRNEKGILWNACREKPLKVWKRFAQSLKKSWRPFFSRETFTQKLFLLTYNANSRRLPERLRPTCESLLPKVQKNGQIYSFYPKKTFVLKQNSGLLKWCFRHSYQKKLRSKTGILKNNKNWMKK